MFKLTLERLTDGQTLRLTQNESRYQLIEVDGIEVPDTEFSTYDVAQIDGVGVSNIHVPDRQIDVTIVIRGNIEYNRQLVHQICRVRSQIRLNFETDAGERYIDGYVKSIESNRFDDPNFDMTISFICPDPYFKGTSDVSEDISRTYGTFFFPFGMGRPTGVTDPLRTATINCDTEMETGIVITLTLTTDVTTDGSIRIVNATTGEYFQISGYAFENGDVITINTINGQKACTVLSGYEETDIIAYVDDDSTWFQLSSGENQFNYFLNGDIYNGSATISLSFTPLYLAL